MPTFRLKVIEVTAVQWNGPQDNPAVRALCDHYASLDHANPYVTENNGARYLFSGDWVVNLSDVTGLCGKIGRYGVFRPSVFDELFEPAAGKLIPPQGGSSSAPPTCDPSTLPRGRSSNYTGPTAEQTAPARSPGIEPVNVVDLLSGKRYMAVQWDGDADTANTFLGNRYGIDWEWERVGSSAILIPGGVTGNLEVNVGDWIMQRLNGRVDMVIHGAVVWNHFRRVGGPGGGPAPTSTRQGCVNGGPHNEDSVRGDGDQQPPAAAPKADEPVAAGCDGMWVSNAPPVVLPNGFTTQPAPIVEYRIVSKTNTSDAANEVSRLLAEGWELHGHLVPDTKFWIQPMVRRHGARPPADPVVPLTKAGDRAGAV